MSSKIKILVIALILAVVLFFLWVGYNIAPGSYVNAERYELNVDDTILIYAIEKFKADNPQYKVPEETQLKDGLVDEQDHWFHIYFYYPQENQIVYTWVQKAGRNKTTFAFVGVNEGLILGNWRDINRDFNRDENKKEKRKFEERILNSLKPPE